LSDFTERISSRLLFPHRSLALVLLRFSTSILLTLSFRMLGDTDEIVNQG
jgi:hypothetical protein